MNHERAYFLLGVNEGSTQKQIKKMYYKKALQCHPDKNGNAQDFQELNDAYLFLTQTPDPLLPILFQSSIHYVLSALDQSVLLSLYILLIDIEGVPEQVIETIRNHIPPILRIKPTLYDLMNQRIYIYEQDGKKYSIPMWHHELIYDEFIVLCTPTVEIDEDNNVYLDVHADIKDIFVNGLYIPSISHQVDVSKLYIKPFQIYKTPSTIPCIHEDIYAIKKFSFFILRIHLI